MTVLTARLYVQQFAKTPSGDTSIYSLLDIDRTIKVIGDDINQVIQCVRQNSTITATASSVEVVFTSVTDFRADRVVKAWIENADGSARPLKFVNEQDIRRFYVTVPRNGPPELIGWETPTIALVYPIPIVNATLGYVWVKPFTSWTDGAVDGTTTATVLNIPDDYLRLGLMYGCTALLQHHEPEMLFTSPSWQKYEQWRDKLAIRIRGRQNPIRVTQGAMILES